MRHERSRDRGLSGLKHLIQCHCILPQYRNLDNPVFHSFVVFSLTDENGNVIPKAVKCNNCDVAHKITDFCKSEMILGIEDTLSVISIDDIRSRIPDKICEILDKHKCDTPTWEQTSDIFENKLWGSFINLSSQKVSGMTQIKRLIIIDTDDFKIEADMRQDDIVREII